MAPSFYAQDAGVARRFGTEMGSIVEVCVRAEDDPMGFPGWVGVSRGQISGWYEQARGEID